MPAALAWGSAGWLRCCSGPEAGALRCIPPRLLQPRTAARLPLPQMPTAGTAGSCLACGVHAACPGSASKAHRNPLACHCPSRFEMPFACSFCHPAGGAAQLCVAAGGIACRTLVKGKQLPPLLPVLSWRCQGSPRQPVCVHLQLTSVLPAHRLPCRRANPPHALLVSMPGGWSIACSPLPGCRKHIASLGPYPTTPPHSTPPQPYPIPHPPCRSDMIPTGGPVGRCFNAITVPGCMQMSLKAGGSLAVALATTCPSGKAAVAPWRLCNSTTQPLRQASPATQCPSVRCPPQLQRRSAAAFPATSTANTARPPAPASGLCCAWRPARPASASCRQAASSAALHAAAACRRLLLVRARGLAMRVQICGCPCLLEFSWASHRRRSPAAACRRASLPPSCRAPTWCASLQDATAPASTALLAAASVLCSGRGTFGTPPPLPARADGRGLDRSAAAQRL